MNIYCIFVFIGKSKEKECIVISDDEGEEDAERKIKMKDRKIEELEEEVLRLQRYFTQQESLMADF